MTIFICTIVALGLALSTVELGIMSVCLINYIKDKIWQKQVKKEMLKKFKKI